MQDPHKYSDQHSRRSVPNIGTGCAWFGQGREISTGGFNMGVLAAGGGTGPEGGQARKYVEPHANMFFAPAFSLSGDWNRVVHGPSSTMPVAVPIRHCSAGTLGY